MNDPATWFVPKGDGLGWTPQTWEGWVIVGLVVAAAAVVSWRARKRRQRLD